MNEQKRVPSLRFAEFSEEWNQKKMKDIFFINAGGDIKKSNVSKVKTENFKYPIYANAEKDKGLYGYSDIYKIEGETLTIAGRGVNIGVAHARNEKYYPIVRLLVLKPKKEENIKFYEYQFNRQNILIESTGVPQFTAPQVSTYSIFKTILEEQQKIAAFLSAVDKKIAQLQQKQRQLEAYKKGVMQQLFSQQLRFTKEDGNAYPDWEEKKLKNLCEINKGKQLNAEFLTKEGLYPCVNGGVNPSGYTENFNREENTITISEGGNSCGYINFINTRFWCGGHCYSLDELKSIIDNLFLYQLLKHNEKRIMRLRVGSGLPNIQKKEIHNFKLHIPVLEEQTQIANFLSAIDQKTEGVRTQIEHTQQFKKGLLQQMFV